MKGLAVLGLLAGLLLGTVLVLSQGAGTIWHSATVLGFDGFVSVMAVHLCVIGLLGSAWWLLGREKGASALRIFLWGRLIRDSASEALPLSQIGGYVLGARAISLLGVAGSFSAASTVVDVTLEVVAQLLYTLFGLFMLDRLKPDNTFAGPIFAVIAIMTVLVALFFSIQARGSGFIERTGARLAREFLGRDIGSGGRVQAGIRFLHQRKRVLVLACIVHLIAWVANGLETWLTLRLMQIPLTVSQALVLDSLLYGMRSLAFMVPNALGVQEGAFVLLGGMFGLAPEGALALSLIKRARDLTIGIPALLVWQAMEGRRVFSGSTALDAAE